MFLSQCPGAAYVVLRLAPHILHISLRPYGAETHNNASLQPILHPAASCILFAIPHSKPKTNTCIQPFPFSTRQTHSPVLCVVPKTQQSIPIAIGTGRSFNFSNFLNFLNFSPPYLAIPLHPYTFIPIYLYLANERT